MTAAVPLDRPAPSVRSPHLARLTVVAGVLCAAVFLAPFPLASVWPGGGYSDVGALQESVTWGFVRFASTGGDRLGAELARAADFWARFHIVKAVLAGPLLLVLCMLGTRLWREAAYAAGRGRRWGLAIAGVVAAPLATLTLLVLVANLQGAIAPLSSVLGMLPLAGPQGQLASAVGEVRHGLVSGEQAPAQVLLLHDFAVYHMVMAALGAAVTVGLLATAVALWRRRGRVPEQDRRWRLVLAVAAVVVLALGGIFGVVTAANVGTAANPAPALLAFFDGGA